MVKLTVIFLFICHVASAQRLEKFTAETEDPLVPGRRVIYETARGYFDYVAEKDSVLAKIIYVWIPDTVTELGIRIISPVNELTSPNRGDIASPAYELNSRDDSTYFDPLISVEYATGIKSVEDYRNKRNITKWKMLGSNDNSPELFPQPDGKKHNALLRLMTQHKSNPHKLFPGLYRVQVSGAAKNILKGSFLLQAGVNKITGLQIYNDAEITTGN